ncbi:MAG: lipid A deacylase LpxR family protein [Pigmentiphaga sp.]
MFRGGSWPQRLSGLGACLLLGLAAAANAAEPEGPPSVACEETNPLRGSGTFNLRIDNDMFGGLGQDQGYSNGFLVSWVSPNLANYVDDPCLPRAVRGLNRYLALLQPEGFDEQNMTIGLGQMMYTPVDRLRGDLIENDRPFAGVLMLSLGYNARRNDTLRTSQIRLGVVGPAAHAKQVQNWWHDLIGVDRFQGWDQQLRNEPVFQLLHERRTRVARRINNDGWGWDLIRHWGASLGNFATYANVGGELRFGLRLPDDLGTAPLRPAGENTSPVRARPAGSWNAHLFAAVDARWVLRDITLDGNTFKSSHSVDKRPFVADVGYGLAFYYGPWRIALARYHRTREFHGQGDVPVYGTITIGRRF